MVNHCYVYGVNNSKPYETPIFYSLRFQQVKEIPGLLYGENGSVVHPNSYFFYIEKGKLIEYGAVPCDENVVKKFENGDEVIDELLELDNCLSITGYYRRVNEP